MLSTRSDHFVGRGQELAALRASLVKVRAGQPQTILVTGSAGIGKTGLLERFLQTEKDVHVLRASGEQWEAHVPFGVLDQLLRATSGGNSTRASGEAQVLPREPVCVGAVLLESLERLEQEAAVVLLLDDAHWADVGSLRSLLFALRRVTGRVLTVMAVRDEEAERLLDGLRRLSSEPTGKLIHLEALSVTEVHQLGWLLGIPHFSAWTAHRLTDHTGGNPLYVRALLAEVPMNRWCSWEPALPAPRAFATQIWARLDACRSEARALVEAASVLGVRCSLSTAAVLGGVAEPARALEEAFAAGLLRGRDELTIWEIMFPHPLIQAAVYEHVGPAARVRLHRAAARVVDDEWAALRHRVAATQPPDEDLAEELDGFARREGSCGRWATAAAALVEAGLLTSGRQLSEQRLVRAVDELVSAGDAVKGSALADQVAEFEAGPQRDAALGCVAALRGRAIEAETLLHSAWSKCNRRNDRHLAGVIAMRLALHSLGRLRGDEALDWSEKAIASGRGDDEVHLQAVALRKVALGLTGLGKAEQGHGEFLRARRPARDGANRRIGMLNAWLHLVNDDLRGVPRALAEAAFLECQEGSPLVAGWCYVWLSRANFLMGHWDEAAVAAASANSRLEEAGHERLGPLARWVAVSVAASRGDWATAEHHVRHADADSFDYELTVVAAALARAELACATGDHSSVLDALEPVRAIECRQGVDEPGFWPWQHLYAEALVGAGHLRDAATFLGPHEDLAAARQRRSQIARLARVRGQLEAAEGRVDKAEAAFRHGLGNLGGLSLPFEQALLELEYGQSLRRRGHRRAAATQLEDARSRFVALGARPYVERCDTELTGSGLARTRKRDFDPVRLTSREVEVARRAAAGLSNRDIAAELVISVKTVQFHVTNIYSKLGVRSRVQLAACLGTADLSGQR